MVHVIAGRYELAEVLGRGGMGAVWRARDRTLGREVAVKEVSLPRGLDDAQVARMYARTFREARSAARLDHPGIVTVHDVVEEEGRPWIVMQLVRADALDKVIAREGLGATLYAAAEGRPPYDRPDVWGVMAAVLSDDPDPVEHAGPLSPVLQGLLRKAPDRRMSPGEAERLLRQVAQGPAPVPEPPRFAPPDPGSRNVTLHP
ncbi:hypothetical protein E1281_37965, partial [Actinomadura sp. KC345]|uniref:protein kinase domain-containing protein n=1 Tax=Actinomadura sp. KC345 TaxID=2530371 RepID=UPI0010EC468E